MPVITFLAPDGTRHAVEAVPGQSLMETARRHGVPGIVAECGGSLMCATCHVFVDVASQGMTGTYGPVEDEMLEATVTPRRADSRLSCQIIVTGAMEGLVVTVAPAQ